MSFQITRESIVATVIAAVIALIVGILPFKIGYLQPVKQEFDDFDIYDLAYSGKEKYYNGNKDERIILVQAATDRADIAKQIEKIKLLQPAVIGIDLSFADKREPKGDSLLIAAIKNDSIIVPAYTLKSSSNGKFSVFENFFPAAYLQKSGGYINFSPQDSIAVIRSFAPFYKEDGREQAAFATRVIEKYSSKQFEELKKRGKSLECIDYSGDTEAFVNYSAQEFDTLFAKNQLGSVKGKIVLLGFFTKNDGSAKVIDDIHFSPLNERIGGKSLPDIYGVVIHANIISMVLDGNRYINAPSIWVSYLISFLLCFLFLHIIFYCHKKYKKTARFRILLVLFVSVIVAVYIFLKLFDWVHLKVNMLPIVLTILLSLEMAELYKIIAGFLHKKYRYKTIYAK
jgi:CHASE2 domain-containing sensor protein